MLAGASRGAAATAREPWPLLHPFRPLEPGGGRVAELVQWAQRCYGIEFGTLEFGGCKVQARRRCTGGHSGREDTRRWRGPCHPPCPGVVEPGRERLESCRLPNAVIIPLSVPRSYLL